MNSIIIVHNHTDDKVTACEKAEQMLEDLANTYGLNIESNGDGVINFSGSGITGTVEINHNKINISAKLSFLMIAMKPVISDAIKNKLEEKFS